MVFDKLQFFRRSFIYGIEAAEKMFSVLELLKLAFQIPLLILRLKIEKIILDRPCDTSALLPEQSVLEDFCNIHVMVSETVLYVPDHILRVMLEITGIKVTSQSPRRVIYPHVRPSVSSQYGGIAQDPFESDFPAAP